MDFFEVVHLRYSHKDGFLSDQVPREHLEQIAAAGLAAPTGCNAQVVSLVIIDSEPVLGQLRQLVPTQGIKTAPAVIAVVTDSAPVMQQTSFQVEDYSAATTTMLLAATALGYASVWLDSPLTKIDVQKQACELLGVPKGHKIWVFLPIGKPDGGSRRCKLPFIERVFYSRMKKH
ncbi:MAG: nitroreductase family protein [Bacillota bacterium]|nr:nitroreductase family protein [Bacillota bacterium]